METPKAYIPLNCWKCKAQNNAAVATVCRVCGAYLREAEAQESSLSYGLSDYPAFKAFLVIVVVVLLGGGGIIYFGRTKPRPDITDGSVPKEIVLPSNSWYNDSWWSYVSSSPSVKQILQKNEEANGETPSFKIARTLSFSGKMSRAVGTCFEQMCIDEMNRRIAEEQRNMPHSWRLPPNVLTKIGAERKPETSDKYDQLSFSDFGTIELLVKIPDRMVRRVTAINPQDETHRLVQISEFFNGVEGRRITDYFDALSNKVKSEVNVMDAQQVESAKLERASLLGKDFDNYKDMELRGLEKVAERIAWAITANNRDGLREKFYFDAVTGFLIKMDTPLNSVYFDDYRPWGQGMLPYKVYFRQAELGGFHSWIKIEITEWKIGDPIEDSVFETPAGV